MGRYVNALEKSMAKLKDAVELSVDASSMQRKEIIRLRNALNDIKVRSYELGMKELHDMAWHALKEVDDE
jgi:hypothetical protein